MLVGMSFLLVIDTEQYSGNFERELCAFITGQIGDCGVGSDEGEKAELKVPELVKWFDNHIELKPDEHGCYRPVSIRATPGWFCDGLGGEWRHGHDKQEIKDRYTERCKKDLKIYLDKGYTHEIQFWQDLIKRGPGNYPASLSVEIYLDSTIPNKLWDQVKDRATEFCKSNKITLTDIYLIEKTVIQTEKRLN